MRKRRALAQLVLDRFRLTVPGRPPTKSQRKLIEGWVVDCAYHEAAHAVVAAHMAQVFAEEIFLDYSPGGAPGTIREPLIYPQLLEAKKMRKLQPYFRDEYRRAAELDALIRLAGPMSDGLRNEESVDDVLDRLEGELVEASNGSPLEDVSDLGLTLKTLRAFEHWDGPARDRIPLLAARARKILQRPKIASTVAAVAEALLDEAHLGEKRVYELLKNVPVASATRVPKAKTKQTKQQRR